MMSPILFFGAAVAAGAWLLKSAKPAEAKSTVDALIDPGEKMHPNALAAREAITVAMSKNSMSLFEGTALAVEAMKMPKTAANVRGWATMVKQGGNYVAGEIGAARTRSVPNVALRSTGSPLPEWLRAQATTAQLTGDPNFIEATARVMGRLGYREHAKIYLKTVNAG